MKAFRGFTGCHVIHDASADAVDDVTAAVTGAAAITGRNLLNSDGGRRCYDAGK